ncbi:uncharacterized protein SCHCODRAFT_02677385 [Schizophyllum commune H4-8]|uniref:Uncharacterized protein n=1 Tax=Schizophyllum commune (strain H4-8 / FGSC 9210) TaxID=578458 RepID=D8PNC5_SCHCM|nr:uncharacterized protein SCHCODRAFT_02677385 [Schizophyllum commune H4-8]KAI5893148.1 hypothetical protein SCHCODRAFT_02677385 [Schizophyllum commune H4-8]
MPSDFATILNPPLTDLEAVNILLRLKHMPLAPPQSQLDAPGQLRAMQMARAQPPPPVHVPRRNAICVPRINTHKDLEIFAQPDPPCATQPIPSGVDLRALTRHYRLGPDAQELIYVRPPQEPPCQCIIETGGPCGLILADHEHLHAPRFGRGCPWEGCTFVLANDCMDTPQFFMDLHLKAMHFYDEPLCPLCYCSLLAAPPERRMLSLLEHYQSGWCTGLAKHAITHGLPVPKPRMPQA